MNREWTNINDLVWNWSNEPVYQIRRTWWQDKNGRLQKIIERYDEFLLNEHIDHYEDRISFWDLFEFFLSINLLSEWYGKKTAHRISKEIIQNLKEINETNGIIQIATERIKYAYIDKSTINDRNHNAVKFIKTISSSTIAGRRSIEIINVWSILKDLLWSDILEIFKILSKYQKPNQSFEMISISEIDWELVQRLKDILEAHRDKYNLGEDFVSNYLGNLEHFLNSVGTFNSISNND